jgi:hypothetical protein
MGSVRSAVVLLWVLAWCHLQGAQAIDSGADFGLTWNNRILSKVNLTVGEQWLEKSAADPTLSDTDAIVWTDESHLEVTVDFTDAQFRECVLWVDADLLMAGAIFTTQLHSSTPTPTQPPIPIPAGSGSGSSVASGPTPNPPAPPPPSVISMTLRLRKTTFTQGSSVIVYNLVSAAQRFQRTIDANPTLLASAEFLVEVEEGSFQDSLLLISDANCLSDGVSATSSRGGLSCRVRLASSSFRLDQNASLENVLRSNATGAGFRLDSSNTAPSLGLGLVSVSGGTTSSSASTIISLQELTVADCTFQVTSTTGRSWSGLWFNRPIVLNGDTAANLPDPTWSISSCTFSIDSAGDRSTAIDWNSMSLASEGTAIVLSGLAIQLRGTKTGSIVDGIYVPSTTYCYGLRWTSITVAAKAQLTGDTFSFDCTTTGFSHIVYVSSSVVTSSGAEIPLGTPFSVNVRSGGTIGFNGIYALKLVGNGNVFAALFDSAVFVSGRSSTLSMTDWRFSARSLKGSVYGVVFQTATVSAGAAIILRRSDLNLEPAVDGSLTAGLFLTSLIVRSGGHFFFDTTNVKVTGSGLLADGGHLASATWAMKVDSAITLDGAGSELAIRDCTITVKQRSQGGGYGFWINSLMASGGAIIDFRRLSIQTLSSTLQLTPLSGDLTDTVTFQFLLGHPSSTECSRTSTFGIFIRNVLLTKSSNFQLQDSTLFANATATGREVAIPIWMGTFRIETQSRVLFKNVSAVAEVGSADLEADIPLAVLTNGGIGGKFSRVVDSASWSADGRPCVDWMTTWAVVDPSLLRISALSVGTLSLHTRGNWSIVDSSFISRGAKVMSLPVFLKNLPPTAAVTFFTVNVGNSSTFWFERNNVSALAGIGVGSSTSSSASANIVLRSPALGSAFLMPTVLGVAFMRQYVVGNYSSAWIRGNRVTAQVANASTSSIALMPPMLGQQPSSSATPAMLNGIRAALRGTGLDYCTVTVRAWIFEDVLINTKSQLQLGGNNLTVVLSNLTLGKPFRSGPDLQAVMPSAGEFEWGFSVRASAMTFSKLLTVGSSATVLFNSILSMNWVSVLRLSTAVAAGLDATDVALPINKPYSGTASPLTMVSTEVSLYSYLSIVYLTTSSITGSSSSALTGYPLSDVVPPVNLSSCSFGRQQIDDGSFWTVADSRFNVAQGSGSAIGSVQGSTTTATTPVPWLWGLGLNISSSSTRSSHPSGIAAFRCNSINGQSLKATSTFPLLTPNPITAAATFQWYDCGRCSREADCNPIQTLYVSTAPPCTCSCAPGFNYSRCDTLVEAFWRTPTISTSRSRSLSEELSYTESHGSLTQTVSATEDSETASLSPYSATISASAFLPVYDPSATHPATNTLLATESFTYTDTISIKRIKLFDDSFDFPFSEDNLTSVLGDEYVETAASAAVATAVASSFSAGSSGGDLQALVLIGLMKCDSPFLTGLAEAGERAVMPLRIGPSRINGLLGALLLFCVILMGNFAFAIAVWKIRHKTFPTLLSALGEAGFPSMTLSVCSYLHQGICYETLKMLSTASDSPGDAAFAVLIFVVVLVPHFAMVIWAGVRLPEEFVEFKYVFRDVPRPLMLMVMPHGFWTHNNIFPLLWKAAFVSSRSRFLVPFTLLIPLRSMAVALVVVLGTNAGWSCSVRSYALASVFLVPVIPLLILRPFVIRLAILVNCLASLLTAIVVLWIPIEAMQPSIPQLTLVSSLISFGGAVSLIVLKVVTVKRWKPMELKIQEEEKRRFEKEEEDKRLAELEAGLLAEKALEHVEVEERHETKDLSVNPLSLTDRKSVVRCYLALVRKERPRHRVGYMAANVEGLADDDDDQEEELLDV